MTNPTDEPAIMQLMRQHHRAMLRVAVVSGVLTVGAAVTACVAAIRAQSIACVTINKNYIMTPDGKTYYKIANETTTKCQSFSDWKRDPSRPEELRMIDPKGPAP